MTFALTAKYPFIVREDKLKNLGDVVGPSKRNAHFRFLSTAAQKRLSLNLLKYMQIS